jgi:hypothetical protein
MTGSANNMEHRQRRLKRDTYLAAAAAVLVVGYLLNTAAVAYWYSQSPSLSLVFASTLLSAAGQVARAVGFIFVAIGFLARRSRRDGKLRRAAQIIAGGFFASFLGAALYVLALIEFTRLSQESSSRGMWIAWGATLSFQLLAAVASLLVASAFGPKNEGARRSRLLALGSVALAAGWGLLLLGDLAHRWGSFGMMDMTEATGLAGDLFLVLAAVVAAIGFFAVAGVRRSPGPGLLARRERLLAYAASSLTLCYLLEAVGGLINLSDVWMFARSFGPMSLFTPSLLDALVSIAFTIASALTVVSFAVSSRSLMRRDEAIYRVAETEGQ